MTNSKKARTAKSNDVSTTQQKLHHGRRVSFDLSHNTVHILPSNKQLKLMIQERERQERERAAADVIANDKTDHGPSSSSEEEDATDAGDKDDTDRLGAHSNQIHDMDTPSDDTNSEDSCADVEEMAPTEQVLPSNPAIDPSEKKRKRGRKGNSKKVYHDVEMFIDGPVIYTKESAVETIEMDVSPDAAMSEAETTEATALNDEEREVATGFESLQSIACASDVSEDESSPVPDVDELYYREKYFPDNLWAAIAEENNGSQEENNDSQEEDNDSQEENNDSQEEDIRSDVSVEGSVNSNSDEDSATRAHRVDDLSDDLLNDIPNGPFFDFGTLDDGPSSAGSSPYSLLDEDEIDGEHGLGALAIVTPSDDEMPGHTRGMIKGWLAKTGGVVSKMDIDNERIEEPVAPWGCAPESLAEGGHRLGDLAVSPPTNKTDRTQGFGRITILGDSHARQAAPLGMASQIGLKSTMTPRHEYNVSNTKIDSDRSGKKVRSSDRAIDGHGGTQSASVQVLADRDAYIAGKRDENVHGCIPETHIDLLNLLFAFVKSG
ncbi:hypothetical protein BC937DRAFT_92747 [Endogone sp. FLAS-F59071]|nr:hypothetical protein BC937DRAFT_92747 [Endogone sp. FLAS-F59071]|eukprot:RUS15208.1 hypothetical protein BC937DRAFT_92747 [Endogone sp. FLAS-F59071]